MSESATMEHARIQTARSIVNVCLDGVDRDVIKIMTSAQFHHHVAMAEVVLILQDRFPVTAHWGGQERIAKKM